MEFNTLKESLDDLKNSKKDTKMFSPLGSGVFIKSEIKDTENVLVNIGSNVAIERPIPESKKLVENQIKELSTFLKTMESDLEEKMKQANKLNSELAELSKEAQEKHQHTKDCKH
jgi:prefoldin alpha subunit